MKILKYFIEKETPCFSLNEDKYYLCEKKNDAVCCKMATLK